MWPFPKTEKRIATSDPYLGEFLGARWTARADVEKASGLAVAHRAVQTIAENLAAMPLKVYREAANDDRQAARTIRCTPFCTTTSTIGLRLSKVANGWPQAC